MWGEKIVVFLWGLFSQRTLRRTKQKRADRRVDGCGGEDDFQSCCSVIVLQLLMNGGQRALSWRRRVNGIVLQQIHQNTLGSYYFPSSRTFSETSCLTQTQHQSSTQLQCRWLMLSFRKERLLPLILLFSRETQLQLCTVVPRCITVHLSRPQCIVCFYTF